MAQGKQTRQLFVYFCQVGGMNRGMGNSAHTATLYDEKPGNSRLFIQPVWAIHTPCMTAHTDRVFGCSSTSSTLVTVILRLAVVLQAWRAVTRPWPGYAASVLCSTVIIKMMFKLKSF